MAIFQTVTHKEIAPITFGGGGYGNTARYEVTRDGCTVLASNARDVAQSYIYAGLPVPEELAGPYDCYGNREPGPCGYAQLTAAFWQRRAAENYWKADFARNKGDSASVILWSGESAYAARKAREAMRLE